MEKKNIVSELPSTNRGRKKLAYQLRKESFNEAYPNEPVAKDQSKGSELVRNDKEGSGETTDGTKKNEEIQPRKPKAELGALKKTESKEKKLTNKKKRRASNETSTSANEFTSFNCLKSTHTRTVLLSALLKKPVYELLDQAMGDYIAKMKKSGDIDLDI